MAALTAFFVMALMLNALNHSWFLIFLYVGGGIPMNTWLMKGYFDTVPMSLDESAKTRRCRTLPPLLANCSSTCSPNGLPYKLSGPSWDLSGTTSSLVSCFVRKNTLLLPWVSKPSLTMRKHEDCLLLSRCYPHRPSNLYSLLLPTKELCFRTYKWVATRDNLSPPPFFHFILFENLFKPRQLPSATSKLCFEQPATSFLVCTLIFIDY